VRAVLDANVLISALLSPGGAPAQILSRWLVGEFELVVSESLLVELERALAYPKLRTRIVPESAVEFVSFLRGAAVLALDPRAPPRRSPDPGDDYLLALAESEKAIVVSGDQHLLELADRFPIRSPRAFLEALEENDAR
jgi:putative PIN family toxin of toxin-antitoxin system